MRWILCWAALAVSPAFGAGPVDPAATPETKALFDRLQAVRGKHLLVGHQHTTEYGVGWMAVDTEDSDVKRTTGAFPALYGWDFIDPKVSTASEGPLSMRAHVLAAHARGGVNTICWHAPNPVTGKPYNDTTPAVALLLPGGERHAQFCTDLDAIAGFFLGLRDAKGTLVPVIFRPWHEHNGNWFWWGTPAHATPEDFAALWRFTVDYLRTEKGVHNLLIAWSPNWSWKDEYFIGYPGDEYVDVFGFDVYAKSLLPVLPAIRTVVERAEQRGKIPAITEAGFRDGLSKCESPTHFTGDLLAPLRDDPVARRMAWLQLWRNGGPDHFWVPPPAHKLADDFRAFYRDPYTWYGDDWAEAGR